MTLTELDWIDNFYKTIRDYLILRDEDDILILPPNRVYKVNQSGRGILRHLAAGSAIRTFPGISPGSRASDVHAFFSNLKAAYEGRLANPDEGKAVERTEYTFDFTRLPVLGEIAITYRCNNRCEFCYASCGTEHLAERDKLSTRKLKKIISTFKTDAKIPFFSFTGGEPLLRRDLEKLIVFAESRGLRTNLVTNGTLATPERARSLFSAGLRTAQVSLESEVEAIHDELVGSKGAWRRTIAGIENLRAGGISVQTNTTLTSKNAPSIRNFVGFIHKIGITRFAMNLFIPVGSGLENRDLFLSYSDVGPIIDLVRHTAAEHGLVFYWYSPTPHCLYNPLISGLGNKSCAAMDGLLSVSPNGDVLPCSSYPEPMGNMLDTDFTAIWFSERARYFKQKMYAPKECEGCSRFIACQSACPLYWDWAGTGEIVNRDANMAEIV